MSDKRKPDFVLMLRKKGKKASKVELFDANQFRQEKQFTGATRYRIRVNGKWYGAKGKGGGRNFYTKWEFRDILFRSIHI